MSYTPSTVEKALAHVRTMHPDVTHVVYTREGKWVFMTDDGDAPDFALDLVDTGLLEDAADQVSNGTGFPSVFCIDNTMPEEPST